MNLISPWRSWPVAALNSSSSRPQFAQKKEASVQIACQSKGVGCNLVSSNVLQLFCCSQVHGLVEFMCGGNGELCHWLEEGPSGLPAVHVCVCGPAR